MKRINYEGTWHIFKMETWEADYFNMEVQAYIRIARNKSGTFQFGLVSGDIDGKIVCHSDGERLEFTWEGNDECDSVSGYGWIKMKNENCLEGEIRIHNGESSAFLSKRSNTIDNLKRNEKRKKQKTINNIGKT